MRTKGILTLALLCIVATSMQAKIIWSDDFEIKEKVSDNWREYYFDKYKFDGPEAVMRTRPGLIHLDQSRKVSGRSCARLRPRPHSKRHQVNYIAADLPPNQGGVLSLYMYDYNESFSYFTGASIDGATPDKRFRVFASIINPYYFTVENPGKLVQQNKTVPRKTGWRKIQFVLGEKKTDGHIRAYVDGRLVSESKQKFKTFKTINLGALAGTLHFWNLFFDAVTLDDDPNSIDKDLYRGVDLTLTTDKVGNVFHVGDELSIKLKVKNYAEHSKSLKIVGKVFNDKRDFLTDTPSLDCEVAPDKTAELSLKFPEPGVKGPLYVKLDVMDNGKILTSSKIGVGVIENPQAIKADGSSIIHSQFLNRSVNNFIDIGFLGNRILHIRKAPCSWPGVEPEKGKFNWKKVDQTIEELRNKYGYSELMYCFHSTPFWASDPKVRKKLSASKRPYAAPVDMEDWRNYVGKTVSRYKDKVKCWEIWNEVNSGHFKGSSEEYFQMLKTAYEAIKKADPDATVVGITTSGIDLNFIEKILKLGGMKYLDVMGLHPYAHNRPEKMVLPKIKALHKLMAQYGGPKPIWDTEFAFYTTGLNEDGTPKTSEEVERDKALALINLPKFNSDLDVANWAARSIPLYLANGFENIYYHGGAPMKHSNGMAKYFTYSLAAAAQMLSGAEFVRKIDLDEDNLHAYLFKKNGEYLAVLWTVNGEENVSLKLDQPKYQLVDLWGNVTQKSGTGKVAKLLLSESPIYLKGIGANIASVAKDFTIETPPIALKANFSLKTTLRNQQKAPLKGSITLKAPEGWTVEPKTKAIEVLGNSTGNIEFKITSPPGICKGNWAFQAEFTTADGQSKLSDSATVRTLIPIPCPRLKKALILDAVPDSDNWENAPGIEDQEQIKLGLPPTDHVVQAMAQEAGESFWEGEDDLSAAFQCAWDDEFLYLTVKVRDDKIRNQYPKNPFLGDCLEIFIDPRTRESRATKNNPGKVFQLLFAPSMNGDKKGDLWLCVRGKGISKIKSFTPEICEQLEVSKAFMKIDFASKIVPDGYIMELKVPFSLFENQKPKSGDTFGFDLAIDDLDQPDKKRESQSFWMGDTDNHKVPSRFGVIELIE